MKPLKSKEYTKEQLLEIMYAYNDWSLTVEDTVYACNDHGSGFVVDEHYISLSNFSLCHDLFPAALHGLLTYCKQHRTHCRTATGYEVSDTLDVLMYGTASLVDEVGRTRHFVALEDIEFSSKHDDLIAVCGTETTLHYIDHGDIKVPFAYESEFGHVTMNVNELENKYPGCLKRFAIARDLMIEGRELMTYTFQSHPVKPEGLDGLELY